MLELSIEEWMFIASYLRDRNATKAYREANPQYKGNRTGDMGWQMLNRPHVKAEISRTFAALKADTGLTSEMIKNDIVNVLNADPRELFNVQQGACRHCHGIGHLFQRTIGEMNRDRYDAEMRDVMFDPKGGAGFDAYADPHPDCPECNGKGEQRIRLTDTRTLSAEAASLLLTIEQTKHGIKITTRSKDAAREAAAKFLGINSETVNLAVKLEDMTNEQLAALVAKEASK